MDAYEEGIYEIIILVMNPVADKPLLDSVLNVKVCLDLSLKNRNSWLKRTDLRFIISIT